MQPQDHFKLIQCYHCLQLADHVKTTCPHKDSPQTCGRCGVAGHPARECAAAPHCHLCGEDGHPATARICQVYKSTFSKQLEALLQQPPTTPAASASSSSTGEKAWESVQIAANATQSPLDFLDAIFRIVKATGPGAAGTAPHWNIGADLDVSQDSAPENQISLVPDIEQPRTPTKLSLISPIGSPINAGLISDSPVGSPINVGLISEADRSEDAASDDKSACEMPMSLTQALESPSTGNKNNPTFNVDMLMFTKKGLKRAPQEPEEFVIAESLLPILWTHPEPEELYGYLFLSRNKAEKTYNLVFGFHDGTSDDVIMTLTPDRENRISCADNAITILDDQRHFCKFEVYRYFNPENNNKFPSPPDAVSMQGVLKEICREGWNAYLPLKE